MKKTLIATLIALATSSAFAGSAVYANGGTFGVTRDVNGNGNGTGTGLITLNDNLGAPSYAASYQALYQQQANTVWADATAIVNGVGQAVDLANTAAPAQVVAKGAIVQGLRSAAIQTVAGLNESLTSFNPLNEATGTYASPYADPASAAYGQNFYTPAAGDVTGYTYTTGGANSATPWIGTYTTATY
jgi:hypothetical protein